MSAAKAKKRPRNRDMGTEKKSVQGDSHFSELRLRLSGGNGIGREEKKLTPCHGL